jgi:hypothetical protein
MENRQMKTFNTNRLRNHFRDTMQEGLAPISDADFSRIVRAFQYLTQRITRK